MLANWLVARVLCCSVTSAFWNPPSIVYQIFINLYDSRVFNEQFQQGDIQPNSFDLQEFMYTVRNIQRFNQNELKNNITEGGSWHKDYDSAYIFIGGLNKKMNQGDIVIVFSQFGEVVDINLVRDRVTGQSKGFAFLAYEDQRSTVLAVDNLNGIELCGRIIRVDHVKKYRPPKQYMELESKMFDDDYRPTGPDGKGWGKFRQYSERQIEILRHNEEVDRALKQATADVIGLRT